MFHLQEDTILLAKDINGNMHNKVQRLFRKEVQPSGWKWRVSL